MPVKPCLRSQYTTKIEWWGQFRGYDNWNRRPERRTDWQKGSDALQHYHEQGQQAFDAAVQMGHYVRGSNVPPTPPPQERWKQCFICLSQDATHMELHGVHLLLIFEKTRHRLWLIFRHTFILRNLVCNVNSAVFRKYPHLFEALSKKQCLCAHSGDLKATCSSRCSRLKMPTCGRGLCNRCSTRSGFGPWCHHSSRPQCAQRHLLLQGTSHPNYKDWHENRWQLYWRRRHKDCAMRIESWSECIECIL